LVPDKGPLNGCFSLHLLGCTQIEHERLCKDDVPYIEECVDWYKQLCVDEHNQLQPFIVANPGWHIGQACQDYIDKHVV